MTLRNVRAPFSHFDWLFELKYDGFRALAHLRDGEATLISRTVTPSRRLPTLRAPSRRHCPTLEKLFSMARLFASTKMVVRDSRICCFAVVLPVSSHSICFAMKKTVATTPCWTANRRSGEWSADLQMNHDCNTWITSKNAEQSFFA
jgi:hypothetical protein